MPEYPGKDHTEPSVIFITLSVRGRALCREHSGVNKGVRCDGQASNCSTATAEEGKLSIQSLGYMGRPGSQPSKLAHRNVRCSVNEVPLLPHSLPKTVFAAICLNLIPTFVLTELC